MNIGQLDGQPLALQIFNGMTAESTCVNERWAKDQLFRCVCFAGGRHQTILDETVGPIFQSPSSVWRTTVRADTGQLHPRDFNPRPPCGGRPKGKNERHRKSRFRSTSSVWRTTFLNYGVGLNYDISIHVLRMEDDGVHIATVRSLTNFNPRPPCGGRRRDAQHGTAFPCISIHVLRVEDDSLIRISPNSDLAFQSTSSVWRTTSFLCSRCKCNSYFNPRPPCGGRPHHVPMFGGLVHISIHVLRVEDDQISGPSPPWSQRFQSTSSVWRTTHGEKTCKSG